MLMTMEISKSIADAMITGPVIVQHIKEDFDQVEALIKKDYAEEIAEMAGSK